MRANVQPSSSFSVVLKVWHRHIGWVSSRYAFHMSTVIALGCTTVVGCARPNAPALRSGGTVVATPVVITPCDDTDSELFARGFASLQAEKFAEAAAIFDDIVKRFPGGPFATSALFDAGMSYEGLSDRATALKRYQEAYARTGGDPLQTSAAFRAMHLLGYFESWGDFKKMAEWTLSRTDLTHLQRLDAVGAMGLAMAELGQVDEADKFVQQGRTIVEEGGIGAGGRIPIEASQLYFALGEIRRNRSEQVRLQSVPAQFAEALERRCQGLLDAQSAYSDAMRSYDPHWGAMSGYRIAQLYQQLHRDVMEIPAPKGATSDRLRDLFRGAMTLRYRVLLEKGLKMVEHTLSMGDRTGEDSEWISRAREAQRELEKGLVVQREVLAALPYSEKELEGALAELAKKKGPRGGSTGGSSRGRVQPGSGTNGARPNPGAT